MKKIIYFSIVSLFAGFISSSCNRDVAPPPPPKDYSFIEGFDSLETSFSRGWVAINNSVPMGEQTWSNGALVDGKKGVINPIAAQSYTYSGQDYAMSSFYTAGGDTTGFGALGQKPTISNWLISPSTVMKNGDQISFYTRCYRSPASFPDRMQVYLNPVNNSSDVGADSSSIGSFTTKLLDINPTYTNIGYPGVWKQYTITLSGLSAPLERRFAFRYYVSGGGVAGSRSLAIGIDQVEFKSAK